MAHHCFPDHAASAPIRSFTDARLGNSIDNTGYFRAVRFVHEALTAIGKDCRRIGKKASPRIWHDLKVDTREAATENRDGFESRA
jgi:hypothetical protein